MIPQEYTVTTPEGKKMRRWRINVFTATWLSYAGFYFCRKNFSIVKKPLRDLMEINDFELAWIWTAYLVAYMIGQFLSAGLSRKYKSRTILLVGMGFSVIANIVFGTLTLVPKSAYWWLLVFMIINGFAQATGWSNNVGIIANWTWRKERGTMMAVWATCYQLGSIAAKGFAAVMIGYLGIVWSFWGASAVLGAVWIFFYFAGQDRPEDVGLSALQDEKILVEEGSQAQTEEPEEEPIPSAVPEDRLDKKVLKVIVAMGLIYFCFKFLRYALDSWAPLLIEENFKTSTATAGLISTAFDWLGFAGVFFAGVISDKFFKSLRMPIIFWMTLGMLIATFLFWGFAGASLLMFAVMLGLIGFMLMGPDSLLSGTAAIDVGNRKTAVFAAGMINGLGSIGPIVQEPLIGYIKTYMDMSAVYLLFIGISVIALIGVSLLWSHTRKTQMAL